MKDKQTIPDADLSNAGDDFHILWTVKKSLELLNFESAGLKAVTIEGIENKLSNKLDSYGEKFLGIDLTEYFGGNDFQSAKSIVISQLKYSTRRADENFTFSKLYEGKKADSYNGSIIHRLAAVFKTFFDEFGREQVLDKIKIKLVSNRNFNAGQLKQILSIQKFMAKNKRVLSFNSVLKEFPQFSKEPYSKLQEASRLNLTEFADFFRLLDFKDCGASSRQTLHFELVHAIAKSSIKSANPFNALFKMIWDKMMPESREDRTFTLIDIVAVFGFSSIENLLPVSQNFEINHSVVQREQRDEVISSILANYSYMPICLHGGAGIGKSTIIHQIKNGLPEHSACILFDCYGAGKYQNPEDKRHLHKNAIVQMANELAKNVGTEFLLIQNESDDVYLKEFIKRIRQAVAILRNRNSSASLVLIIDAADNSITAARNYGESSFVMDLLNIEIPEGCHIVATSRSYRRNTLGLPAKHIDIELKPFSLNETALFITNNFPKITNEEILDFHSYTKGIPRVQFYSLNLKKEGINQIINYLKPNGKDVSALVLDKIDHAVSRLGKDKKELIDHFFRLLISLPRPVPINYLAEIMKVEIDFLKDLASDIWNGLILDGDLFSFRDEDFENYIRQNYQISLAEQQEIAQIFLSRSDRDEYASVNLGNLLFNTGLKQELIDIVLNRSFLAYPKDSIRNKEVYMKRTKLALKTSTELQDNLTYFKLLVIAAEESKSDKALGELLIKYPDLVASFGDELSLSRLKLKSDKKPWAGAFHLKLSGIYSRRIESREIALRHLKTAREWINWRGNKNEEERRDYPLTSLDIAYETETVLRLHGIEKAVKNLNRWNPRIIRIHAGIYLTENVLCFSSKDEIGNWSNYLKYRIDAKIFIICRQFQYKLQITFDLEQTALKLLKILSRKQIRFEPLALQLIVEFCGILAYHKIDAGIILEILNFIHVKPLDRIPYFYGDHHDREEQIPMDILLAKETLIFSLQDTTIDASHFFPAKFTGIDEIKDHKQRNELEDKKKEFELFFNYAVPVYQILSDLLTGRCSQTEGGTRFEQICSKIENDHQFKYQFRHWAKDRFLYLASKLIPSALLLDDKTKYLELLIRSFDAQISKLKVRIEVLNQIILLEDFLKPSLKLLHQADTLIKDLELSSKEATDEYIKCLILSRKIDESFSKYFFEEAIKATTEIDYEAFIQIRSLSYLAERGIPKPNPKLAYQFARFIEHCDIKLGSYDKKHFPYTSGLVGIGNLDMPSMLAVACRWHHRNIIELDQEADFLIKASLENGYMEEITAASLLPLKTNYSYDALQDLYLQLIGKFNLHADSSQKSRFASSLLADLRLAKDQYFIRRINEPMNSGKEIAPHLTSKIERYLEFLNSIEESKKEPETRNTFRKQDFPHKIDLDNLDPTSAKELEKSIDRIIVNNSESYNHRWSIENLLSDIIEKCPPKNYTKFLNALVDVSNTLLDFSSFEDALEKALEEWSFYPEIKTWKKERFKEILQNKLHHFDYAEQLNIWSIKRFADLFSIEDSHLAEIIVEMLPKKIDLLTDESIYSSFELIKNRLSQGEIESLLQWTLERWNLKIKNDIADGVWRPELVAPENAAENTAGMIRFILGHPDKQLRWRAVHCLRRLANYGNAELIPILLDKQNCRDCMPFQNQKFLFYWMSSKLYLWIALERISSEKPELLTQFKDIFFSELLSSELPHVLIKHYIKKACLNLNAFDNSVFTDSELDYINRVNTSKIAGGSQRKGRSKSKRNASGSDKNRWKFRFNALDTLPYWYSRVGNIFDLSEYEVADVADKFISEKWGYSGNPHKDDFLREQLYDRQWSKTSHRQGSNPEIENLATYFEYHAMFCAADYLLENVPVCKTDFLWDSWENWLASQANGFDSFWLSDITDPVPLETQYWKNDIAVFDKKWRKDIKEEYFDRTVGFTTGGSNGFLNLYGGTTRYIGANQETITIRSCLVSHKGADALLRALHTAKDSYDYAIPFEENEQNEEDELDRHTIDSDGLLLKGWLMDIRSETDGLDSDDPFFSGTTKGYVRFGKTAHSHFQISYDKLFKTAYYDNALIGTCENWNEISDEEYAYRKYNMEVQSSGSLFKVDSGFILKFLKAEQKSMIIKCHIDRQLEERKYKGRYDDNRKNVKLYLITEDGTVKTLRGENLKIR